MRKKILLTGGGTLGPVSPLIAVFEELQRRNPYEYEFRWIGTSDGPENALVARKAIPFATFPAAKLRRYLSIKTIFEPFVFFAALIRSLMYLLEWRPRIILSAGGFVSVPVVIVGRMLKIPVLIHQQDITPGLSNKLMTPFASRITVTFEEQKKDFPEEKVVITGNPVRADIEKACNKDKSLHKQLFKLEEGVPVVLIIGGGSGAAQINTLTYKTLHKLTEICQIIHVTGRGKACDDEKCLQNPRYHMYEFLPERMPEALSVADVVVSRAGMSFITEFCALGKPTIIVPIPHSHQELNAEYLKDKNASVVLNFEYNITNKDEQIFFTSIQEFVLSPEKRELFSNAIKEVMPDNSTERLADEVEKLVEKNSDIRYKHGRTK